MTPKGRALLLAYAMMAMGSGSPLHEPETYEQRKRREETPNWKKKCFREACENKREGNKLYCSAECNKLDKIERKNKK